MGDLDDICKYITHSQGLLLTLLTYLGSHTGALGSSPRKDLAIGLQGMFDSLKLIPPLGSTVHFKSRARHSWAVTSQGLSMASHLVLAISAPQKRLPIR